MTMKRFLLALILICPMYIFGQSNVIVKPADKPIPTPTTQSGIPKYTNPCPMTNRVKYSGTRSGGYGSAEYYIRVGHGSNSHPRRLAHSILIDLIKKKRK